MKHLLAICMFMLAQQAMSQEEKPELGLLMDKAHEDIKVEETVLKLNQVLYSLSNEKENNFQIPSLEIEVDEGVQFFGFYDTKMLKGKLQGIANDDRSFIGRNIEKTTFGIGLRFEIGASRK